MLRGVPAHQLTKLVLGGWSVKRVLIGALLVGGVALGCEGPFSHTNPYDTYAIYTHEMQGARTASDWAADTLDFELISTPDVVGFDVTWSVLPGFMSHLGNGRFVTQGSGLATRNVWVRAKYGIHGDSVQVQLRQLPESLSLRCQSEPDCPVMTNIGAIRFVTAFLYDVNDQLIPLSAATDLSTAIIRDPSIATISGGGSLLPSVQISAQAEGSTWFVGTVGGRTDSVLVTVDLP